jgi:hypothetical protein
LEPLCRWPFSTILAMERMMLASVPNPWSGRGVPSHPARPDG